MSSDKFGVPEFKASCSITWWGSSAKVYHSSDQFDVSIQGIYSQFSTGGPSAKVGLSANFGGLVFKASLLYYLGGPSAKISFYNNITYYTWQI